MSLFGSFWRDSSADIAPASNSLIPLPTVSTLLDNSQSSASSPSRRQPYDPSDPYLPLQRAETALQHQLQDLLDAQSAGLFPKEQQNAFMGSQKLSGRPAPSQSISLADARSGIRTAMRSLTQIKAEQAALAQKQSQAIKSASSKVQSWIDKEASLQADMQTIREMSDNDDLKKLNDQNQSLQEQINHLEGKLGELRLQQSMVQTELAERGNALNSRIASSKQALALVDKQKRNFLHRPPPELFRRLPHSSFMALKPERRSVDLATESLKEATDAEIENLESSRLERQALKEGVAIWTSVVEKVTHVEQAIRQEMKTLSLNANDHERAQVSLRRLREQLDETVHELQKELTDAEEKGRSLLVCCIGAELEALQNGQQLLLEVAQASSTISGGQASLASMARKSPEVINSPPESRGPDSPVHEFKGPLLSGAASNTEESDADPENLLIARRDTDETD